MTALKDILSNGSFENASLDVARSSIDTDAIFSLTGRSELVRVRLRDRTSEPSPFPGERHHFAFAVIPEIVDENLNPTGVTVTARPHTVNGSRLAAGDVDLNQLVIQETNDMINRLLTMLAVNEVRAELPFFGGE